MQIPSWGLGKATLKSNPSATLSGQASEKCLGCVVPSRISWEGRSGLYFF